MQFNSDCIFFLFANRASMVSSFAAQMKKTIAIGAQRLTSFTLNDRSRHSIIVIWAQRTRFGYFWPLTWWKPDFANGERKDGLKLVSKFLMNLFFVALLFNMIFIQHTQTGQSQPQCCGFYAILMSAIDFIQTCEIQNRFGYCCFGHHRPFIG